jgi:hypothetical protein
MTIQPLRVFTLFVVFAGVVLGCPANCPDCNPAGNYCYACAEGYEADVAGQCVSERTVDKCSFYSGSQQCLACQPTYELDGSGYCVKNWSPCLMPDTQNSSRCSSCGFGTVLSNGQCTGAINCGSASVPCPSCASGFLLTNNGKCSDQTGNCQTVDAQGFCRQCKADFNLIGYLCVPKTVRLFACYLWNADQQCIFCKSGYVYEQGYCLLYPERQELLAGTVDLQTLVARNEQRVGENPFWDPNCQQWGNSTCSQCQQGFSFNSNNSCLLNDPSCSKWSYNGLCKQCSSPSTLQSNGSCTIGGGGSGSNCATVINGVCQNCQTGYELDGQNNCVGTVVDNCQQTSNGVCVKCSNRYYVNNGKCQLVSPQCQNYSLTDGSCTGCYGGFQLSFGTCVVANIDPNCAAFDGNSGCIRCVPRTYFNAQENKCLQVSTLCSTWSNSTGECTACYVGYELSGGKCATGGSNTTPPSPPAPMDPLCKTYTASKDACASCYIGYTLVQGKCQVGDPNPLCKTKAQGS